VKRTLTAITAVTKSSSNPALSGIIPRQNDIFIYQKISEIIPLFFLLFPLFMLGIILGVMLNEFVFTHI
jgi:hypothetical protein